jgi:pimeloyl-ACP methyl ester carboxylesterase
LKMMPGIGHFVMLEDAEKFNKLLEEIIKEL